MAVLVDRCEQFIVHERSSGPNDHKHFGPPIIYTCDEPRWERYQTLGTFLISCKSTWLYNVEESFV
jgi:hypothetical protein